MKLKIFQKIITLSLLPAFAILTISCQKGKVIEAYENLYAAVKSKDTEKIKQTMSKNSLSFAEFAAGQHKKPIEEVLKNGFTATTFSETLPEIRDERIKDKYGAVEVWNAQDKKWEDLPFILEDGVWKFAVGDAFKGSFKSPGKGLAAKGQESTNSTSNTMIPVMPPSPSSNVNISANTNMTANSPTIIKPIQRNNNANK